MEIEFTLAEKDFIAFYEYVFRQPVQSKKGILIWIYLAVLGLGFSVGFFVLKDVPPHVLIFRHPVLMSVLLIGVLVIVFGKYVNRWRLKKWIRNNDAFLKHSQRMSIDEERLFVSTPVESANVKWAAIQRIATTRDHAFLFKSPNVGFIVPRSAFPDDEGFEAFVAEGARLHEYAKDEWPT